MIELTIEIATFRKAGSDPGDYSKVGQGKSDGHGFFLQKVRGALDQGSFF